MCRPGEMNGQNDAAYFQCNQILYLPINAIQYWIVGAGADITTEEEEKIPWKKKIGFVHIQIYCEY